MRLVGKDAHACYRSSWYKPGQSWNSVLGECSSSFEECRAEAVALYRMAYFPLTLTDVSHRPYAQWSAIPKF
jgi:hypothetical protein